MARCCWVPWLRPDPGGPVEHIVYLEQGACMATFGRPAFPHRWVEYPTTRPEELPERLAEASIVIVNKVRLEGQLLRTLPRLRLIAVAATGTNNVDLQTARELGIVVSNVRGYANRTVPEHVLAMMLALSRNLSAYHGAVAAGDWQRSPHFCLFGSPIRDLHGQTLVIVGSGELGQGVARLGQALGMEVVFSERRGVTTPRPGYCTFTEALARADILSLHCPLTPETRGLVDEAALRAMRPHALLINTARGGVVEEAALARALREGWIGGAGVDVLAEEPPGEGSSPLLAPDILALPNFLLTPHVAWASLPAQQALADQVIANMEAFVAGQARNVVNAPVSPRPLSPESSESTP